MTAPKKAYKVRQRELKIKDSNRETFLIKTQRLSPDCKDIILPHQVQKTRS